MQLMFTMLQIGIYTKFQNVISVYKNYKDLFTSLFISLILDLFQYGSWNVTETVYKICAIIYYFHFKMRLRNIAILV